MMGGARDARRHRRRGRHQVPYELFQSVSKTTRTAGSLFHDAITRFEKDRGSLAAAALAFYGLLSLGPTVVIVTELVALVLGAQDARAAFGRQLTVAMGPTGAAAVERLATDLAASHQGHWGVLGIAVLLYAATRVFAHLQDALNQIWNVRLSEDRALKYRAWHLVKNRVRSLLIVGFLGAVLLASVAGSTVVEAVAAHLPHLLPTPVVWRVGSALASALLSTFVFSVIYRTVPDARVGWDCVWPGALLAGLLFAGGKLALGWYVGSRNWGSVNETATALLIVLLWASYSAHAFLFGAEFAEVWSERYGSGVEPYSYAVRTTRAPS